MKTRGFLGLVALAAITLGTSCSNDELYNDHSPENAIGFSTYLGNSANTRASVFTTDDLKSDGFGVYAYYTGQTLWENSNLTGPNFMNNTKVTFDETIDPDGAWTYSPLKYWPNTLGDKVSFFAYAPWTDNENGDLVKVNNGIIAFTVANDVTEQIDLTAVTEPKKNVAKGALDQKVEFSFKHVLSRIEFTLRAAADLAEAGGEINEGTIIILNEIKIGDYKNTDGTESALDKFYTNANYSILTNKWSAQTGRQFFTLDADNFIDGSNVLSDNETKWFKHGTDGFIISSAGITYNNEQRNLIDEDNYIMIIPQTITELPVYVNYTVKTVGKNAAGEDDNSEVINQYTTTISSISFEQGKVYKFNLVLGLSTVELSANLEDWDSSITENAVSLPLNTSTTPVP